MLGKMTAENRPHRGEGPEGMGRLAGRPADRPTSGSAGHRAWWIGWLASLAGVATRTGLLWPRVTLGRHWGPPRTETERSILRAMAQQQGEQAAWCLEQADWHRAAASTSDVHRGGRRWNAGNTRMYETWAAWHSRRRKDLETLTRFSLEAEEEWDAVRMSWEYLRMELRHHLGPRA